MLTRLKVSGFKNLVDVDVRFGPFTCIAGANGVGKSNLFDAVQFLSALADGPLMQAASSIRGENRRSADIRSLFHHIGDHYDTEMSFEAEMIIPDEGVDDLGQKAKATITFLRYTLILAFREDGSLRSQGPLEIVKEELTHINLGEAKDNIWFEHAPLWRKSAIQGARRGSKFISTEIINENRLIKLHQDKKGGNPISRLAVDLPRTVLSSTYAAESPTALLARREMQSWRLLQLEPSSLRAPDEFNASNTLSPDGKHLPATIYRLAHQKSPETNGTEEHVEHARRIYAQIANRLAGLIEDVRDLEIDRDESRRLLTLLVSGRDKTKFEARALSDGTLRFLALSVIAQDPESRGVICLEEPENGIHPERIPAMIELLMDIATDVTEPVGPDNPLRQVIINTHSPAVVSQVPDNSLLMAELKETFQADRRFKRICFTPLSDTWRVIKSPAPAQVEVTSKGKLLAYLNPVIPKPEENFPSRRVVDRKDLQQLWLPFPPS